jgi:hypothetical protein
MNTFDDVPRRYGKIEKLEEENFNIFSTKVSGSRLQCPAFRLVLQQFKDLSGEATDLRCSSGETRQAKESATTPSQYQIFLSVNSLVIVKYCQMSHVGTESLVIRFSYEKRASVVISLRKTRLHESHSELKTLRTR